METAKDTVFLNALLPLILIIFIIGVGVILLYQHFQKNLYAQKLKEETLKAKYQIDLLRLTIEAEEEERKRIAQDLHDELGAALSIMRMNIVMLEQKNGDTQNGTLNGLATVRQLSETALASVRNISHRLMPPQLETFGLLKTLEGVVEQVNSAGTLSIEMNAPSSLSHLSRALNLALYRVAMELINNSIKHSGATEIKIDFVDLGKEIRCVYADNGKGLPKLRANRGLGIKNVEGRIKAVDGTFSLGDERPGFLATIHVPVG